MVSPRAQEPHCGQPVRLLAEGRSDPDDRGPHPQHFARKSVHPARRSGCISGVSKAHPVGCQCRRQGVPGRNVGRDWYGHQPSREQALRRSWRRDRHPLEWLRRVFRIREPQHSWRPGECQNKPFARLALTSYLTRRRAGRHSDLQTHSRIFSKILIRSP